MQGSLVSARLVFALLVALFSQGEREEGVLIDRLEGREVLEQYLALEEAGEVTLLRLEEGEPRETVTTLRRAPGASHLFLELEGERVYSMERFFSEEFQLRSDREVTLELPSYPARMVERAGSGEQERELPTEEWLFRRSGELLYIYPGSGATTLVARPVR
ncbi:MAG: hypothetical protein ACOC45_02790 [Alkalispirochaetaceae bacterium]